MSKDERAITASTDRSCRLWKVPEESQLVFRGHSAAIDCLYQLNEGIFLTGSQDGCVARSGQVVVVFQPSSCGAHHASACLCIVHSSAVGLWGTDKKRPSFVYARAHGIPGVHGENPWIASITGIPRTDLVVSGSSSGYVQLWRCNLEKATMNKALAIPVVCSRSSIQPSTNP
jgi:ribosomal RNA-processing protein 9